MSAKPSSEVRPPEFELSKLDGRKVSFGDLEGNPAVRVFWTAQCASCKEEAPLINKLADDYDGKGISVLGINIGEGEARLKKASRILESNMTLFVTPMRRSAKSYSIVGTPTIVFLDKNGITRYVGNELPKDYSTRLDTLISEN